MKEVTLQKVDSIRASHDATYNTFVILIVIGIAACLIAIPLFITFGILHVINMGVAAFITAGLMLLGGLIMYFGNKHLKRLRNDFHLSIENGA